jgi:hypothetical protein
MGNLAHPLRAEPLALRWRQEWVEVGVATAAAVFSPAAVTCGARRLGAALRFKPHHQIAFAAKNLLSTNSRAVI